MKEEEEDDEDESLRNDFKKKSNKETSKSFIKQPSVEKKLSAALETDEMIYEKSVQKFKDPPTKVPALSMDNNSTLSSSQINGLV